VRTCVDAGTIDDYVISIHPAILGGGTPLFPPGTRRSDLVLTAERRFPSGLVQLTYRAETTRDSAARPA